MFSIKCTICNDRKYVLVAEKWKPCSCLLELQKKSAYDRCGIPDFFQTYTWGDFLKDSTKMSNIVKLLKQMIDKVKSGHRIKIIHIKGDSNSGKQSLAFLLLKEVIGAGLSAKFVGLDELIQMEFDKERRAILSYIYEDCDFVCLRLGTTMEHSYTRYVLEKFLTTRKNNNKQSIITSRLDIEANAGLYGKEVIKILTDGRRTFRIEMR